MNRLSRSLIILLLALLLAGGLRSVIFAQDVDPSAGDSPQASDFFFLPYVAGGQDLPTTLPPLGPKEPKDATAFTKALNERLKIELPFDNTQAFTDVQRGLIAPLPTQVISTTDGSGVAWDPEKFSFITLDALAPDTVNPSLWRESQLANVAGLFKVTDRLYQVRNADLSNMTIIEGDTGLIIVDPLVSVETAEAALALYRANRPMQNVVAVIYTHSHVDHWGGVLGVTSQQEVDNGVEIYAPVGFLAAATAENIYAGGAMGRRANYMYGTLIPGGPRQGVGTGLGTTISEGSNSLLAPTQTISVTGETRVIDGMTFEFLLAPNSEAPSEMLWYMPELKALNGAEDATHTMHNVYSLRGAKVRDALAWSKYLNEALDLWGDDVEVLFNMHHWPVWGNTEVVNHLEIQRDLYRFINDQTLNLANQGYTPVEIAEMIRLPRSQEQTWSSRGYYGSLSHNVKAVYDLYLGWFDGNPANLHPLPPAESSAKYVELMGGADAVLTAAKAAYARGEYRWVAELVNHLVFADPTNQEALYLQADTLEQLGYQAEAGPWRNFYLTGAEELRNGVNTDKGSYSKGSIQVLSAISLDQLFDFLAIHLSARRAEGQNIILNWVVADKSETAWTQLENSVVNHTLSEQNPSAAATITIDTATLAGIIQGDTTAQIEIDKGKITITGDILKVIEFFAMFETFDTNFNIVTP
ncbi:MAG: MBL fold metallo-hydrolase [Caldilinea sp.]|nr:MBL fold metallo-hydrolase [Caldilinea sp.]MCW5845185.1 MBL fold metallo-hydrolase [Caldilinea sp.]